MVQPAMLTSSPRHDRDCDTPQMLPVDEMEGWASVAEALLQDCARAALVDVAEPCARQTVLSAYTESLAQLVQQHLSAATATHRCDVAQEARLHDEVPHQLHALSHKCDEIGEQLVAERTARIAAEEQVRMATAEVQAMEAEREALQSERAAVWQLLRTALLSAPPQRRGTASAANATLEDHVHTLCDRLAEAEAEAETVKAAAAAAAAANVVGLPQPAVMQLGEATQSVLATPRAAYRRILPAAPLNPVTASLLRVKEQVQQLREPSVTQLQQAVGAYRPLREENWAAAVATTPSTRTRTMTSTTQATTTGVTPLPVDRSLGLSRSYTPTRSAVSVVRGVDGNAAAASPPPWRTHIAKLQVELKGLRRDLGAASPH